MTTQNPSSPPKGTPLLYSFMGAGAVMNILFFVSFVKAMPLAGKVYNPLQRNMVPADILYFLYRHWNGEGSFWLAQGITFLVASLVIFALVILCRFFRSFPTLGQVYLMIQSIFALALLDLISKTWIFETMGHGQPQPIIPGLLNLTYRENTGAAWSMLEGHTGFLAIMSVLVSLIVIYFVWSYFHSLIMRSSLSLVLAGALGNLYDRAWFGYVRDFVDLNQMWPVFNLADSYIVIGATVILIYSFWEESFADKKEGEEDKEKEEGEEEEEEDKKPSSERGEGETV